MPPDPQKLYYLKRFETVVIKTLSFKCKIQILVKYNDAPL